MHRGFGSEECGYSRALVSRPSAERRSRTEREPGPSATTREAQYGCRLRSVVSPPRSTQVGFTRLASSNCRSRAGPRSVSRCARPGHERSADRERTAGRSLNSRCQTAQSSLFPRRVSAPGFVFILSRPSLTRGGRSADRRTCVVVARARRDFRAQRGAARPMTRDARLSALHRGGFRPGAALPSPALPPCSELLAARSSCLAGGVPDLPSLRLRAAAAGRHSPLRLQDRLRKTPLLERGCEPYTMNSFRSQYRYLHIVAKRCRHWPHQVVRQPARDNWPNSRR